MIAAIMQPAYLPWIGYFDLMDQVDCFLFLTTVQFSKQSWQQRNRVRTAKGLEWLTVPTRTSNRSQQLIEDVEIVRPLDVVRRHSATIRQAYARAPFFETFGTEVSMALERGASSGRLVDLNIAIIRYVVDALGIKTSLRSSTDFASGVGKTQRLADLCSAVGASTYLSPLGSAGYIATDLQPLANAGVRLAFQDYVHPRYTQLHEPFMSHACVLDLLFLEGPNALSIIRSGRRTPMSLEDALAKEHPQNGADDA